ncbi:MAG: LysE family transporter [Ignavibacteria bacterium]
MIIGFVAGFITGFILSMPPLGPTFFAIIDRGLKKQVANGVAIGAGAGFMDMIYIFIAYGGLAALISILPFAVEEFLASNEENLKMLLALAGGIVVILYGIKIMKTKNTKIENPPSLKDQKFKQKYDKVEKVFKRTEMSLEKILHTKDPDKKHSDLTGSFMVGVVMCLSSITLPASWFAVVGYLKSYGIINSNFLTGTLLGIGVLVGTTAWFYIMTKFISKHSDKIKPGVLNKLNVSTGIFLILLGVGILIKLSTMYFG